MESPIITRDNIRIDIADEIMRFALKLGAVLSPLIGIWAVSCLIAGLITVGPLQMVTGYFTAITGF